MKYEFNKSGMQVRLDILANADKSIVGLEFGTSKIVSLCYSDFLDIAISILGVSEKNYCELTLLAHPAILNQNRSSNNEDMIIFSALIRS